MTTKEKKKDKELISDKSDASDQASKWIFWSLILYYALI